MREMNAPTPTRLSSATPPAAGNLPGLDLRPLAATIGAEVHGVDLRQPVDAPVLVAIRAAFLQWKVLVFRGQHGLTPDAHKAFGAHFGSFAKHPFRPSLDEHPELLPIAKEPDERVNVGGGWHTDMTFMPAPPFGTLLYAVELPAPGLGDTMWTDNEAAFAGLSPGLQATLRGLRALHTAEKVHGPEAVQQEKRSAFRARAAQQALVHELVSHPVVRTHPETGRPCLFVNPSFTVRFDGWSEVESQALLAHLFAHMAQPEYVVRVHWQPGTLVLWDNRNTQHYALNDYHGQRREMRRLMIEGEAPY
jgi:taurine dioxygenase